MPHYRIEGKLTEPMTDQDFIDGMTSGKFIEPSHRAYCVLLYYSAVRKSEARRALKEQFRLTPKFLVFEVKRRLKHGIETPPLKIPLKAPFVTDLAETVSATPDGQRVFSFSDKTAYNVVRRVYHYPHFFRLSRITSFFADGWSIAQVKNWTGLSLAALEYYVGLVDIDKMAESLAKKAR